MKRIHASTISNQLFGLCFVALVIAMKLVCKRYHLSLSNDIILELIVWVFTPVLIHTIFYFIGALKDGPLHLLTLNNTLRKNTSEIFSFVGILLLWAFIFSIFYWNIQHIGIGLIFWLLTLVLHGLVLDGSKKAARHYHKWYGYYRFKID
jgi:hypothetical protein